MKRPLHVQLRGRHNLPVALNVTMMRTQLMITED
jgi:hypothetical protein